MSKIDPERAALIARIKVAAKALDIPQEAVKHVIQYGTSYHRGKAVQVLGAFSIEHGVSLDWLICDDIEALLRYAAIGHKLSEPDSKVQLT